VSILLPETVHYCLKCGAPNQNLSLRAMAQCQPGTVGYYKAASGWSPEPCECAEPEWDDEQ
jgi:hypothetical protein